MQKAESFFAGCVLVLGCSLAIAAGTDVQVDPQAQEAQNPKPKRPWMVMDHKNENLVYPLDSETDEKTPNDDNGMAGDGADKTTEMAITTGGANSMRYACMLNDLIRRVEVDYFFPDANVPCQVNYYKDVENPGVKKILWSSETFEGYCEEQAQNLLNELVSWGWNCQAQ